MSLTLHLTLQEVNQVLQALGEQPYVQVHALIEKIRVQAENQLQPSLDPPGAHEPTTLSGGLSS